jgi:hypothetical protein
MSKQTDVLTIAYSTRNSRDEIERYYADIRGRRKPPPENLRALVDH